jgi:PAS domain S-box-containing protein
MKKAPGTESELIEEISSLKKKIKKLEKAQKSYRQLQEALTKSEAALRKEQKFNTLLFDTSPALIVAIGSDGKTLMMNRALLETLEYTAEEVKDTDYLTTFVPEEDRDALAGLFRKIIETGVSTVNENRIISKSGRTHLVEWHGKTVSRGEGDTGFFVGVGIDITERKKAEEALRDSEERFRSLFRQAPIGTFIYDHTFHVVDCNDRFAEIIQSSREKIIGLDLSGLKEKTVIPIMKMALADCPSHYEGPYEATTSETFLWISAHVSPLHDADGHVLGGIGTLEDISKRVSAEAALRESEEKFRTLAESSPIAIMMHQEDRWIYANRAALEISGYSEDELYSMHFWELVHPDHRDMVRQSGYDRQQGKVMPRAYEFKIITKSGEDKWVSLTGSSIQHDNKPSALICVTDITEHKVAEAALTESEIKYRRIFESFEDIYYQTDENGIIRVLSPSVYRLTGWSSDELIGKPVSEVYVNPGERESLLETISRSGFTRDHEILLKKKDGTQAYASLSANMLTDPEGKPQGMAGTLHDITDRKLAEEERVKLQSQLQQAQKIESVGRLAGGVAHDFNNMLGVILGHTELALMKVDPGQSIHVNLMEIRKAAERSADLTRQLLAFARKQTVVPRVLDLNETVKGMLKMLRRLIGEDIDLKWQPATGLWAVKIDPSQIDQILANLCVNARDAIAGVGKITIETGNSTLGVGYCAIHAGAVPGEYVHITVRDNGCGMDKETMAYIFEPFFSTKGVGEGTGLGLATVYGAVKQNNGFIDAQSEQGQGTTFTIYLPRYMGHPESNSTKSPAETANRGRETILLVEDEPTILQVTTTMLELQGYTVIPADTPGEAIRLARGHAGEIHLLMTDVVMPEMNGRDLAKNLLSIHPQIKRLFMSGYTADVIAHHGVLDAGFHFIHKPFSLKEMADKVRETLDCK